MFNQNIKSPVNIPVSKIHPFEGNPYKVLDNDEMNTLICSIQEQGILHLRQASLKFAHCS